ncbi:aldehyde dehydrogenase family protein [Alicyclobacillus shizuokensis]|uniref:aldehyde dehydrogenase family protein n=1 Tax=Alicyclobacillus shizuokensis TaxID=392014 RepID=UPI00082DB82D|nr:aldehyde dehydrogenase family protein [Alicyclobacillus shizuokensis]
MSSMKEWLSQSTGHEYGHFINGEWLHQGPRKYELVNPALKEQVLGLFWEADENIANEAVRAAHHAFDTWSQVPGPGRAEIIAKFASLMERDRDELAYILSAEQGKPLNEAIGEVQRAIKEARFAAGEALRIEGKIIPSERTNVDIEVIGQPIGVVAAIAPWNFPVVTPVRKIAPALAYGCTVVYKPATLTPWSSSKLMSLLREAGVPAGVVNQVIGSGQTIGPVLVNHPLVRGISFTGSSQQGMAIQQQAARRLIPTQLELGGKNPAVVLDTEDVESVARQIVNAAFACSGQRCTAISRVIVVQPLAEVVTAAILQEVKKIQVGPAWDAQATMGPLISEEHLNTVVDYVHQGLQEGATLAYGGEQMSESEHSRGHYMLPTLFTNVTREMRIAREEIFGPVLSIITAADEEDAISMANDVAYGLAATVFTNRLSAARMAAKRLQAGMVHINHGTASEPHVPFGGIKESGYGPYSIGSTNQQFYMQTKVVYTQYQ